MFDNQDDDEASSGFGLEIIDTAQSERVGLTRVVDLRRCRRIDVMFEATMISEFGKAAGVVSNLSSSGLRFEGAGDLPALHESYSDENPVHAPEIVDICFSIPGPDLIEKPVVVQARTVYIIGSEAEGYKCGAEFRLFVEGEQAIEDFLLSKGVKS